MLELKKYNNWNEKNHSICEVGDKRIIELEKKSIRFSSLRIERKKELKKNEPDLADIIRILTYAY